mmetsp:Transcript_53731/g.64813  ORF Transcript_53731/g.64813 Transcript_53731/m.64813 type:complete len:134 (+) Transcript_53731:91-492(+)|eukprot:CAMPEP_0172506990 /NCGR_PEP_ID=MMETSP1066-20121228/200205_1 /TAXON_ID=671091 /ORGANISM="Coscinodiscus wailesii, Strain CCMP2513" /LENGTH=133 /DNA_ID=CAMNT_0013284321 /DNA_START=91 /DNA_END=492 /DNA_ORIENTATION=+
MMKLKMARIRSSIYAHQLNTRKIREHYAKSSSSQTQMQVPISTKRAKQILGEDTLVSTKGINRTVGKGALAPIKRTSTMRKKTVLARDTSLFFKKKNRVLGRDTFMMDSTLMGSLSNVAENGGSRWVGQMIMI